MNDKMKRMLKVVGILVALGLLGYIIYILTKDKNTTTSVGQTTKQASNGDNSNSEPPSGLSGGVIGGAIAGGVVFILVALSIWYFQNRKGNGKGTGTGTGTGTGIIEPNRKMKGWYNQKFDGTKTEKENFLSYLGHNFDPLYRKIETGLELEKLSDDAREKVTNDINHKINRMMREARFNFKTPKEAEEYEKTLREEIFKTKVQ